MKDLTGQRFGKLTAIKQVGKDEQNNYLWLCKCDCGESKITKTHNLTSGHVRSCGCLTNAEDLTGQRFGHLVVKKRTEDKIDKNGQKYVTWECICDCGNTTCVTTQNLKGKTQSCGCYQEKMKGTYTFKHGYRKTRLYRIYNSMKQRCNNPNIEAYKNYGARGITVCDEWNRSDGLASFCEWALSNGYADNLTLDRINNDDGYSPENCRWVTQREQMQNTRRNVFVIYRGKKMTASNFAKLINIPHQSVSRYLKSGLSVDEICEKAGVTQ